jgi:K+-transporting ATPase KdpF subunit
MTCFRPFFASASQKSLFLRLAPGVSTFLTLPLWFLNASSLTLKLLCCSTSSTLSSPSHSSSSAGSSRKPATTFKKETPAMDYIIGGITTLFLFAYLIYALLKPEKF